ncbi:hypothetical protein [Shewanella woodyi]|uniref:Transmembrane anchor protein n=1 Tax=Shewanella woodyi (strain ATCC 51908 / MS32) TaxID=392500 RepID=B1KI94_SHEWM|nr:hypothetical protein [Shewanella woodyi]ACA86945.1 conserved hypothetical protein [Shewanella woodyi ATCC 51908]
MTNQKNSNEISVEIPVHSTATLVKASIAASMIAAVVLLIAILPAEYNIDPTGLGKSLGLTQLSQNGLLESEKVSGSSDPKATLPVSETGFQAVADAPSLEQIAQRRQTPGVRSDLVNIDIPAGKGLEYKLLMDAHTHLEYEWSTDGEPLYFDFHGEPKGDKTGYFESFSITTSDKMKGSLTTPFAGSHGWYWKNQTDSVITVTLSTKGDYQIKG